MSFSDLKVDIIQVTVLQCYSVTVLQYSVVLLVDTDLWGNTLYQSAVTV